MKTSLLLQETLYFVPMKILMILASENFRDTEYLTPRAFFEQAGFEVHTTSNIKTSTGRFGFTVKHDFEIDRAKIADYQAILFVGGLGSLQFETNTTARDLAIACLEENKVLGAICAAPRNLLSWGLLKGKKCTGNNWDSQFPMLCKKYGADYKESECIADENIVTANGPEAVEYWALSIIDLLKNNR